jgi:antitoxin MazE
MRANIIDIGNSKGIRLSKAILQQFNITDEVNLDIKKNQIILTPVKKVVRKDWGRAFQKMAKNKEDRLLLADIPHNDEDWQW